MDTTTNELKSAEPQSRYQRWPLYIAAIYLAISVLWIVFSDQFVVALGLDSEQITGLQTIKGLGFITASAVLIFFLVRWPIKRLTKSNRQLAGMQETLEERERYYRSLIHSIHEDILVIDRDYVVTDINNQLMITTGTNRDEAIGRHCYEVTHKQAEPCDKTGIECLLPEVFEDGIARNYRHEHQHNGSRKSVDILLSPLKDKDNKVTHVIEAMRDVSDLVQAMEDRVEAEKRYHRLLDNMLEGCQIVGRDWRYLYLNAAALKHGHHSREELFGHRMTEVYPGIEKTKMFSKLEHCMKSRIPHYMENEFTYSDGSQGWFELSIQPVPEGIFILSVDITKRKKAEERINHLATTLRAVRDVNQLITREKNRKRLIDKSCEILVRNRSYGLAWIALLDKDKKVISMASAGIVLKQFSVIARRIKSGDSPHCLRTLLKQSETFFEATDVKVEHKGCPMVALHKGGAGYACRLEHKGKIYGVMAVDVPSELAEDKEEQGLFLELCQDVSYALASIEKDKEHKQLESEKKKLESRLIQSQKMEAVGQLAGGVAHDFNNLLTPILGYSDLIMEKLGDDDSVSGDIEEIKKAAERAAALTKQLLTFSRRQVITPRQIDLNATVSGMENMLRRLIGEDVEFKTIPQPKLKPTMADAGQVEQIIINMAVNARDAMPDGGSLIITTENVVIDKDYVRSNPQARPGEFVLLSFEDNGCGMDKETLEHIFEPFFTTKKTGEGTGLGLSTVYGIMKQHKGWINVYSEPEKGTVFKLYFPASMEKAKEVSDKNDKPENLKGQGERILLVEDEPGVRNYAVKLLEKNGYEVFVAANAGEAYELFEKENGHFDLVFSDVVLPDEAGPELVGNLLKGKPNLRILMSSGYANHKAQLSAIEEAGYHFIHKPYGSKEILKTIRETLNA